MTILRSRALTPALAALLALAAPLVGGCSKSAPLSSTAPSKLTVPASVRLVVMELHTSARAKVCAQKRSPNSCGMTDG